jgi:hypothetical protein
MEALVIQVIFGLSILEFIATAIVIIDFGPEVVKKIKAWGDKDHWLS